MQKVILFLALAVVSFSAFADKAVKIEFADETTLVIRLADEPQIINQDGSWLITSQVVEATYERSEVSSLVVGDYDDYYVTGIGGASTSVVSYSGGKLSVAATPGTVVLVYTTAGQLVRKSKTDSAGTATVDLQSLAGGTYIIKCGGKTIKINK